MHRVHPHQNYPLMYRRRIRRRFRVAIYAIRFITRTILIASRHQKLPRDREWLLRCRVPIRTIEDVRTTLTSFGIDVSTAELKASIPLTSTPHRAARLRETIRWFHNQRCSSAKPSSRRAESSSPEYKSTQRPQSAMSAVSSITTARSALGSPAPIIDTLRQKLSHEDQKVKKSRETRENPFFRNHFAGRLYHVNSSPWWKTRYL